MTCHLTKLGGRVDLGVLQPVKYIKMRHVHDWEFGGRCTWSSPAVGAAVCV